MIIVSTCVCIFIFFDDNQNLFTDDGPFIDLAKTYNSCYQWLWWRKTKNKLILDTSSTNKTLTSNHRIARAYPRFFSRQLDNPIYQVTMRIGRSARCQTASTFRNWTTLSTWPLNNYSGNCFSILFHFFASWCILY